MQSMKIAFVMGGVGEPGLNDLTKIYLFLLPLGFYKRSFKEQINFANLACKRKAKAFI